MKKRRIKDEPEREQERESYLVWSSCLKLNEFIINAIKLSFKVSNVFMQKENLIFFDLLYGQSFLGPLVGS